jgi:UDP-glucuronate decarboxylase
MKSNTPVHILLTGGTGFFGKALLRHLLAANHAGQAIPQITLLSRDPLDFQARHPDLSRLPGLRCVAADILEADSLPQGLRYSHVLHAAADSTQGPRLSPRQRFNQIVDGTRHILDYARTCGAKRFLLTSSGAVYGAQPADLDSLPEDWPGAPDPMEPELTYGNAKRAAEALCAAYFQEFGLETVIARCFSFVGQDLPLDVHFAIGNFIRDALQSEAITVHGDGSPVRSYLDQSDLAHWLLAILDRGHGGQAYNVGSNQAITIAALAHQVRDMLAPGKPVRINESAPNGPRNRYVPCITKSEQELGLRVTVDLADAIRAAATSHRISA